jgi:hypothetical protein
MEKVKKFHIKVANVVRAFVNKTKVEIPFSELLDLFGACMKHIDSPERAIRQAYLSALKTLIVEICEDRADIGLLQKKVLEECR